MVEKEETKQTSPVILQDIQCPVCSYEEVKNYTLKAKTLPIHHNIFEVPVYDDNPKYIRLDFNELQFTVCPICFYTGASKTDFNFHGSLSHTDKHTETDKRILEYWKQNTQKIKSEFNVPSVNAESFVNPRTPEAALLSVNLAIHKASIELGVKIPYSMIKRAHRYVRLFCLNYKYTKTEDLELLKKAVTDLEEIFRLSDFPEKPYEFEVCYLIVVCSIKLGDESKAASFIKVLDQTKAELGLESKTNPKVPLQEITKWSTLAKEVWQNRTDASIWII
ncbi:DUF2225 domain-containing protein [Leptospira ilyithenensis]|uniref:DUF2225 domain-containing protein n=1 Tax=Leptospira ilyithenensis TaxID=2484901 RepID=UPI0014382D89|nr:DUF2225 domain-containing protein [Leptospira ilyithenensis]